ncbi:MAG: hypothetical protein RBR08_08300 [Desulforegulaceae bacterium]|nr:hypothetical protein [Desulforegulaceae bacterium]
MQKKELKLIEYEITYDELKTPYSENLPKGLVEEIQKIRTSIYASALEILPILKKFEKKYGHIPYLYNLMSAAYMSAGEKEKAEKYVEKNYKKFPDYLFSRINYADISLYKGNFKKIPEIFDNKFDLKSLYPKRDVFHISELTGFNSVMCMYFMQTKEFKTARFYYKMLKKTNPGHPKVKEIKRIIDPYSITFWLARLWAIFKGLKKK